MPTNLYGPNDNFDLATSHVLPALMRKFHDAKTVGATEVVIWGTGKPRREFLHADDLADACVFLMDSYDDARHLNIGTGEDLSIRELAEMVRNVVHPAATLQFDTTKPDGMPRKLLDVSGCTRWDGATPFRCGKGSSPRISGSSSTTTRCDRRVRRVRLVHADFCLVKIREDPRPV